MGRPKRSLDVMCMFRISRFCDCKSLFIYSFIHLFDLDVRAIQQNTNEQAG